MKNGWIIKHISLVFLFAITLSACSTPLPVVKTASPSTSAPLPPEPERIVKPVNVNFSSFSKDWPVGWQWIDPDEINNPTSKDVQKGVLRVTIPTKKDMRGDNRTAPRYLKAITGDFQIETRVRFLPKENYQGAGLLIYLDYNNYIRFERAYGGVGGGGEGLRIDVQRGNEYKPVVTPADIKTDLSEVELKIVRSGGLFAAYWRENENFEWREAGEFESDYPDTILAGVSASNTARALTAEFVYIRLLPSVKSK